MQETICPKCGSTHITFQREQSGSVGARQNTVVIQNKRSRGCLYWLCFGWLFEFIYFICFGWIKMLFGGRKKSGLNFGAEKTFNHTIAVCQNCGNSWKV